LLVLDEENGRERRSHGWDISRHGRRPALFSSA
jgi:hypothetical protein